MMTSSFFLSKSTTRGLGTPLAAAAESKIVSFAEKRQRQRHAMHEQLFMQVVSSPDTELNGVTLSCFARETSVSGLAVQIDRPVAVGSQLDLWVNISTQPGKYFLSGTVRWIERQGSEGCQLGVELHASAATDIQAWRQQFA